MITLRQLHYFVTVADEGQLTSAARKLFVAQPALSQSIAQLEHQVGVPLLERHARGVSLTVAGEALYQKASAAVRAASDAEVFARSLGRAGSGALELGFMGTLPMVEAPDLFGAFAASACEVDVLFHELPLPTAPLSGWLDPVDVALICEPPADRAVAARVLRREPRVLLANARHPLATRRGPLGVADVLDERFVGVHPDVDPEWAGVWRLDDHRGGPAPHVSPHRSNSQQEITAVVLSGRAITAMPETRARGVLASVRGLVALPLADAEPIHLSLVWRADDENPVLAAFLEVGTAVAEAVP